MHRVRFLRSQLSLLRFYPFLAPAYRCSEISRLKQSGEDPTRLALLEKQYRYPGNQTCAGTASAPCRARWVSIRATYPYNPPGSITQRQSGIQSRNFVANHFAGVKVHCVRIVIANFGHSLLGTKAMSGITKGCTMHWAYLYGRRLCRKVISYKRLQATSTMQHNSAALAAHGSVTHVTSKSSTLAASTRLWVWQRSLP